MNNPVTNLDNLGGEETCRSCGQVTYFRDTGIPANGGAKLVECSRCGAVLISQQFDP